MNASTMWLPFSVYREDPNAAQRHHRHHRPEEPKARPLRVGDTEKPGPEGESTLTWFRLFISNRTIFMKRDQCIALPHKMCNLEHIIWRAPTDLHFPLNIKSNNLCFVLAAPSPPNYRKRPNNEKATDDYHYEKFKKMNRRYWWLGMSQLSSEEAQRIDAQVSLYKRPDVNTCLLILVPVDCHSLEQ